MRNIEIKSTLEARAPLEARLSSLGARHVWTHGQRDTFYRVAHGWLKLREEQDQPPELIAYRRPTDQRGPRVSEYQRQVLADAPGWHTLLAHVLEREAVVSKQRSLWSWRHTRVHLDRVEGLGDFLELETVLDGIDEAAGRAESEELIAALELDPARFLAQPYRVLLAER